jgi:capsular polysaccharide biosynthesis protein
MTSPTAAGAPEPTPSKRPRWPILLVIATTAIALILAAIYLTVRSDSYEASANVLVAPLAAEDPNFQTLPVIRESSDGARPVQTGAGLLSGPGVARLAAANLGGDWTAKEIEGDVTVVPRGESNIVAIVAKTESAASAAELANAYTKAALALRRRSLAPYLAKEIAVLTGAPGSTEQLKQLQAARHTGDPTLSVSAAAQVPTGSANPSAKLVLLAALIVGLLLGIGVVLVANVARAPRPTSA